MAPVEVRVEARPGEVIDFDDFCLKDPWSVALDGYVSGPTRWDSTRQRVTWNHHEDVQRYGTRATCEQVAMALQAGLLRSWQAQGACQVTVWANDADPDVALSVWLLRNPWLAEDRKVAALVRAEGMIDTTAGCWLPAGEADVCEELAWVIEPWLATKRSEVVSQVDQVASIIEQVGERCDAWYAGNGGRADLRDAYRVVGIRSGVAVVKERSPLARSRYAADGIEVFVTATERSDSAFDVSVGRVSPWNGPDLTVLWDRLNALEGIMVEDPDRWGGSDTIGGSPRRRGTQLNASTVAALLAP